MYRLIGISAAILPFIIVWSGHMVSMPIQSGLTKWVADISFFRWCAWIAISLGGFIALLNFHLSFIRPLFAYLRGVAEEDYRFISGIPIVGSVLLMICPIPLFPRIWPCIAATILIVIDTGGPLWFLIATWKDDSLWNPQKSENKT